jgi:hypothetical protein
MPIYISEDGIALAWVVSEFSQASPLEGDRTSEVVHADKEAYLQATNESHA